jgi:hypothetical protein
VVGGDEAGALGDGDQGAEVVKEVDEEEDEDDFEQALVEAPRMSSLKAVAPRARKPPGAGVQWTRLAPSR